MPFHIKDGKLIRTGPWPTTAAGRQRDAEAKWKFIIRVHPQVQDDGGPATCSFCHEFYANACKGCPVEKQTGQDSCDETPYTMEWWGYGWPYSEKRSLESARSQLAFLKALRPKNRKAKR